MAGKTVRSRILFHQISYLNVMVLNFDLRIYGYGK